MGRRPQPHLRQQLLDACTDYALENGLPDRLSPFAEATQTSARMLIYHFGTRDQLLVEVLRCARRRQIDVFTGLLQVRDDEPYAHTLRNAWSRISGSEGQHYFRLLDRLHGVAGESLWPGFRVVATTDWLDPLESGLRSIGRSELATLTLAVIRGLLLDLDSTGDTTRVDQAFDHFLATLT